MEGSRQQTPFGLLGEKLKQFRENRQESLAEVSGAVEIDTEHLERIERGEECPTEDILALLINHLAVHEHEARQLWEWAGFSRAEELRPDMLQELMAKAAVVVVALDTRVLYSDSATVMGDQNGLVLNFMQTNMQAQPSAIARVGMSYEHAEKLASVLQAALLRKRYMPEHKLLPPGPTV